MNRIETTLFLAFGMLWIVLWGVYHFMIFAVNRRLPTANRIPHFRIYRQRDGLIGSHGFEWKTTMTEYKRLYPSSLINYAAVGSVASIVVIVIAFVALRVWEYTHGRLP